MTQDFGFLTTKSLFFKKVLCTKHFVSCSRHWWALLNIDCRLYLSNPHCSLIWEVRSAAHHHHHHISVMELGHLLTHSSLTYPEVSSKVCHDSFCQLENSVSLPWVIYYEAFYLHVVSSFSCTPVICPKLMLFLIPL